MSTRQQSTDLILKPTYDEGFDVNVNGLAQSKEISQWSVPSHDNPGMIDDTTLDQACQAAASSYAHVIQKMSFGILGTIKGAPNDRQSLYFRPLKWKLMAFAPLEQTAPNEYVLRVEDGFLRSRHASPEHQGGLYFRWTIDQGVETFQTEVRDYTSRLVGRRAFWLARFFYIWTQMLAHRYVSWRFHRWVWHNRAQLLTHDGE